MKTMQSLLKALIVLSVSFGCSLGMVPGTTSRDNPADDWLDTMDTSIGLRRKRAIGTDHEDTKSVLVSVPSQSTLEAAVGDGVTFKFEVDFANLEHPQAADLEMEFFGFHPDITGPVAFHICQAHVEMMGTAIVHDEGPFYEEEVKNGHASYVEKSKILLKQLYTPGYGPGGGSDNEATVTTSFQAVLVDPDDILATNTAYYVGAAASVADGDYLWVGSASITTNLQAQTYDYNIELVDPPDTAMKGTGYIFLVTAYITHPVVEVNFGVFQPLGYNDVFHIGTIFRAMGDSFSCSPDEFWEEQYVESPSRLTIINASISNPFLVNTESTRDVMSDSNRITFYVPVHVLQSDVVEPGLTRFLNFELSIGGDVSFSDVVELIIEEFEQPEVVHTPTVTSVTMLNPTAPDVLKGDSVIYEVLVTLPVGWSKFNVTMASSGVSGISGVFPVGTRVVDPGYVAYFSPDWSVLEIIDSDNMRLNFDMAQNTYIESTTVKLEVSYRVDLTAASGLRNDLGLTVGGETVLNLDVNVIDNNSPTTMFSATKLPTGMDTALYDFGEMAIEYTVTIPSSAGTNLVYINARADPAVSAYTARFCRIKIVDIGSGLPCLRHTNTLIKETYLRSDASKPFADSGEIPIGTVCPFNDPSGDASDNQFRVMLYFEMPPQAGMSALDTYDISGGIRTDAFSMWAQSETYTLKGQDMSNIAGAESFHPDDLGYVPFVSSYPIITTRYRSSEEFENREGFLIQYIFKPQPLSRGDYVFTLQVPPDLKLCRLEVTHIGENLPCLQRPQAVVTPYDNALLVYDGQQACGQSATLTFKGLTNWGREPFVPDLTPDANAVQMTAYMKVCDTPATPATVQVIHSVDVGTEANVVNGGTDIKLLGTTKEDTTDMRSAVTGYTLLNGDDTTIYHTAPKLMSLEITVPLGFQGGLRVVMKNGNFEDKAPIDLCAMTVVDFGANMPCLDIVNDAMTSFSSATTTLETGEVVYEAMYLDLKDICFIPVELTSAESLITVEVAFRVRADFPLPEVTVVMEVIPAGVEDLVESVTFLMTVLDPDQFPGSIPLTDYSLMSPTVSTAESTLPEPPIQAFKTGDRQTIPFYIQIAPQTTVKIQADFKMPLGTDGKAIFHATDVSFDTCLGTNVLCTAPDVHLRGAHEVLLEQSAGLTTYMQTDVVSVDLGYVTNAGFSVKRNRYDSAVDDVFAIKIEVQMSDHADTVDGASFDIGVDVTFGDVTVVSSSRTVTADRSTLPRADEIGDIIVEAFQSEDDAHEYSRYALVDIFTVLYHDLDSRAEGHPGRLRVSLPKFLSLEDSYSTNYTSANGATPHSSLVPVGDAVFDFVFEHGMTYADIVSLNFSLRVDPDGTRIPGTGPDTTSIVLTPLCHMNQFGGYPTTAPSTDAASVKKCGTPVAVPVTVGRAPCIDEVFVHDLCQVTASSTISSSVPPFWATSDTSAWLPAHRLDPNWPHYITFDFTRAIRLTGVSLAGAQSSGGLHRSPERVLIQVGLSSLEDGAFEDVVVLTVPEGIPADGFVMDLGTEVYARFARIVILEVEEGNELDTPIGVNRVRWFGCLPNDVPLDLTLCPATSPTVDSMSASYYRHFAAFTSANDVYFCDNFKLHIHSKGNRCFRSTPGTTGKTWEALPSYITRIVGFSPNTNRMYLAGENADSLVVLSSVDEDSTSAHFEASNSNPGDLIPPVGVPGMVRSDVGSNPWDLSSDLTGGFEGISNGMDRMVRWDSCCYDEP